MAGLAMWRKQTHQKALHQAQKLALVQLFHSKLPALLLKHVQESARCEIPFAKHGSSTKAEPIHGVPLGLRGKDNVPTPKPHLLALAL